MAMLRWWSRCRFRRSITGMRVPEETEETLERSLGAGRAMPQPGDVAVSPRVLPAPRLKPWCPSGVVSSSPALEPAPLPLAVRCPADGDSSEEGTQVAPKLAKTPFWGSFLFPHQTFLPRDTPGVGSDSVSIHPLGFLWDFS